VANTKSPVGHWENIGACNKIAAKLSKEVMVKPDHGEARVILETSTTVESKFIRMLPPKVLGKLVATISSAN
jgi:hypothetical protein